MNQINWICNFVDNILRYSIENVSDCCWFLATVSYFTDSSSSVALLHWGSVLVHSMTAMKVRLGGIVPFTSLAPTLGTSTDQFLSTLISTQLRRAGKLATRSMIRTVIFRVITLHLSATEIAVVSVFRISYPWVSWSNELCSFSNVVTTQFYMLLDLNLLLWH